MRIRTVLTAAVLASVAAFPLTGVASAQAALPAPTDRDCRDFASQAAAQSALRSHSGDPARLDPDHNGVACEDYFKTAQPGAALPVGTPGDAAPAAPALDVPTPAAPAVPVPPAVPAPPAPAVPPVPAAPLVPAPDAPAVPGTAAGTSEGTSVKTAAPADAVVRTVPEHQILAVPHGAADTGDGSTDPGPTPVLLLAGALGAVAATGGGWRLVRRSR